MSDQPNYYTILEIAKTASADEVKRAFRKQALRYHPDRNREPDAAAHFKQVNEAYGVLSDPVKRDHYDRYGLAGLGVSKQNFHGSASDYRDIFGSDLFEQLFATLFRQSQTAHGQDIQLRVSVSLETIACGDNVQVSYTRRGACHACAGTGCAPGTSPITCGHCNGRGQVRGQGFLGLPKQCEHCQGRGVLIECPCQVCGGLGVTRNPSTIQVPIPLGAENGQVLRVDGWGHEGRSGGESGDLYLELSVQNHAVFTRQGGDLTCSVTISFVQATLGGEVDAPTLDGSVKIKVPPGTQSGRILRIKGRGLPAADEPTTGHLFVNLSVYTPQNLTEYQIELLRRFEASFEAEALSKPNKTKRFWQRWF